MAAITIEQALQLAISHHQAGRLGESEAICRQILAVQPKQAQALHCLGICALQKGQYDEALRMISEAVRMSPNQADYHCNLGTVFRILGRLDEAIASFRKSLVLRPKFADAKLNLGESLDALGCTDEAIACYRGVLEIQPHDAEAHNNLGNCLRKTGHPNAAISAFQRAIAIKPDYSEAHYNAGCAYSEIELWDKAILSLEHAVALRPAFLEALRTLGTALAKTGHAKEALATLGRALALNPHHPDTHHDLAIVLLAENRIGEATASCNQALAINGNFAEGHNTLGLIHLKMERLDDALCSFEHAIRLKPDLADAHWNLSVVLLQKGKFERARQCCKDALSRRSEYPSACFNHGLISLFLRDYEQGWRGYEWRWHSPTQACHRRNFGAPQWDGNQICNKTIVVHAEQGYGDAIQFVRYLPHLIERACAREVVFECPQTLIRLFSDIRKMGIQIVQRMGWNDAALPPFDVHIPLLSLPFALGMPEPLRMCGAYLNADVVLREHWSQRLMPAKGLRVGLAWRGDPTHENDRNRSIDPGKLLPLIRIPGITFYSLQIQPGNAVPKEVPDSQIRDLLGDITDFADTAALMSGLDLIITVDTAVAHLAGALGRPVWTLLPFVPDWRWGLEKEDTPWYPTMRLFRQPSMNDWDSVVLRVAEELGAFTGQSLPEYAPPGGARR